MHGKNPHAPHAKMRWKKMLLLAILFPPVLVLACLLAEHLRGRIALSHYLGKLRSQGIKLEARNFILPFPKNENGAPEVLSAAKELKPGVVLPKTYPPRMRLTPAGRAIVGFKEEQWVDDKVTNHWEELAADLQANESTLKRIQTALARPVLNCEFDPTLGPRARFTHLTVPKTLAQWFGPKIALALHEGRPRDAVQDLVTEIELPRMLASDGIVISELVRVAIAAIARADTWEALQADGWRDEDLVQLQQAWQSQHFVAQMIRALEGERIFAQSSYQLMRNSNQETAAILFWADNNPVGDERPQWERTLRELPGGEAATEFFKKQLYCRLWRFAWLDQDHLHYLTYLQELISLIRDAADQRSLQKFQPLQEELVLRYQNHGWYDRLRYYSVISVGSLSRTPHRAMRAETEKSLVLTAIALKRYSLHHAGPPENLNTLVPEFLPSVPVDYMDGKPLKFHRESDGELVLYSIGEDFVDDGGDTSSRPGNSIPRALWSRKDVVWPAPATAGELETYRRESARN